MPAERGTNNSGPLSPTTEILFTGGCPPLANKPPRTHPKIPPKAPPKPFFSPPPKASPKPPSSLSN